MKHRTSGSLVAVALAVGAAFIAPAFSQSVRLRVADSFPNGHFIAEKMTKPWVAELAKQSNGALTLEYYPAEQLGKSKDLLQLTGSGVVDIAYVAPAFVSDKMPLSVVPELPLDFKSSCDATAAFYRLASGEGILAKTEFGPNKVHLLWALVLKPYQVMLGPKVKFEGLKSLQGLKLRTTGGAKEFAVRELGAVPVQIPSPEVYESVSRGTVDGALFPYTSVYSYGLEKAFQSSTLNENFGSFVVTYVINESKWKAMSPALQKIVTDVSEQTQKNACKVADEQDADDERKLKAAGWTILELSAADKQTLHDKMGKVSKEWADGLDRRGKQGTATLNAYTSALKDGTR